MPGDLHGADLDRRRVPGHRARLLGRDLRADLPRRLGRPAGAAGPADPAVRAPADDVGRLLLAPPGGRADLAAVQRRRGARHARHGRHRHAVRLLADADRHGGDPVRARRPARAADLHRLPGARARVARASGSSPPTPTAPRARRSPRSPPTCRRRCRASASCARSRRSRATWTQLRRAQRGEPRGEHEDGQPQRRLLPGRRAAVGPRHRRDPALRRHPGARRATSRSASSSPSWPR